MWTPFARSPRSARPQRSGRPGRCSPIAVAAVTMVALAGCAGREVSTTGSGGTAGTGSPSADSTPTATSADGEDLAPDGADASPGASGSEPAPTGTGPLQSSATPTPSGVLQAAVVKDIRAARHDGFDRVVVEFEGTFGRWSVSYADRITEDPTGDPVDLRGSAFLAVVIANATFDNIVQAEGGVPHVAYEGPRRVAPGLPAVQEVADAGDFEAVMSLGIGVAQVTGIRAYRLESPSRLVVDVAH